MFCSGNVWVRWRMWAAACLGMTAIASHVCAEEKGSTEQTQASGGNWVIVHPAFVQGFRFDSATAFSAELSRIWGQAVPVHASTRGKGVEAMRWSLSVAPQQPSVLLLPEESVLMGESRKPHPAHVSNYETLLVLGFKRWCMFVHQDSPVQSAVQLRDWVGQQTAPIRIALPLAAGRMHLWVQGMVQNTQHAWEIQSYRVNGDFAAALTQGRADLALARCDRIGMQSKEVRVLVQSGDTRAAEMADVPTFEQAGLLPFEHGWSAFFAPKSVPVRERAAMAQALHRAASSMRIQQGLKAAGFQPADLSPSASRAYIERFVSGWELVEQFLMGEL